MSPELPVLAPMTPTLDLGGDDIAAKRRQIRAYFIETFDRYEALFSCLACPDAWYQKAIPLRHPLIFYYGHTAAFFINKLLAGRFIDQRIDPRIESMVAIGVDEMSWDDLNDSHYDWPSVEALADYRQQVRTRLLNFIDTMPLSLPIDWHSPAWAVLMGIEHERIHLETSSVLIRQLPLNQVQPQPQWPVCPQWRPHRSAVPANSLISVPGGALRLGKPQADTTYGWDNEYGQRQVILPPFQASRMLVSNAEFYEFVLAGGYQQPQWWSEEGWRWCQFAQARMPTFWVGEPQQETTLQLRTLCQLIAMPWDWPVEVNQLEAAAFCSWKAAQTGLNITLPTEAEWCQLASQLEGPEGEWPQHAANLNLAHWASSCPVDMMAQGDFYDVAGNVWQWTRTPIDGYDGFAIHPLYDDFSTPTFDGRHDLIKGGSWVSSGNLAIRHSRYAFRRHFFQHAGLRYLVSNYQENTAVNPYVTDLPVAQALESQYGAPAGELALPETATANPWVTLAALAARYQPAGGRALEMGCGVGRGSFELARYFAHVDGVDFSARFIDVALMLARQDRFLYALPLEGALPDYRETQLSCQGIGAEQIARVHFSQGDPCNLKPVYQGYDLVLAVNLLEQLREPVRFVTEIVQRLNRGGVLLLSSAYQWQEAITPPENWLGGRRENGEALGSYQALQRLLAPYCDELDAPQALLFWRRDNARHLHALRSEVTCWRRR